jgi:hypothetical protein
LPAAISTTPILATFETAGYRSVIVSESFARRYSGGRSPIGHRVGVGNLPDTITNIGIVGDGPGVQFRSLRDDRQPQHAFLSFAQTAPLARNGAFYLKVRGEPESSEDSPH